MRAIQRFETVLVPTDFSEGSVAALDRALALPLRAAARIDLVHVMPAVPAKLRAKAEAAARDALEREVSRARSRAPGEVTSKLRVGEPYVEIIRHARNIDAELIVIGRHGRRPVRDLLLGTTVARVIRMGDTPTLAVRGVGAKPYHRPLVALDLSDTSRRILALALQVAEDRVAVTVVHAVHVPFEGFMASTAAARGKLRRPMEHEASARLGRLLGPYEDHARWRPRVRTGDARTIVVNEAIRCRADVIVVGTHGRSGAAHALIGSVAEWVIANAPCDVLVSRPTRFSFELP